MQQRSGLRVEDIINLLLAVMDLRWGGELCTMVQGKRTGLLKVVAIFHSKNKKIFYYNIFEFSGPGLQSKNLFLVFYAI